MKNLLKKVLTLVSALALLVSSTAMVYAEEEQTEAPVAEASDINAEAEALAAQQAAEEEAAQQAAEEEAAQQAAEEEAARIAAEEAAQKAAEEEAARIAAEEAAQKAAEEEAARIAAEEAAQKAAEEEAARIAAEEAAKKAAEEEAARIAAEEAAKKAAEEEAARIAAEEAAKKAAEEEAARIAAEEAAKQNEEVPSDNNNEETLSEEEEDSEDGEIVELSDDWGYVDPEIIADYVPEVTVELKYPDIRELKINEKLSGTIDAENNAEMFIRCGGNKTIVLGLYASSENVAVEINGNAVNFTKAEPATATTDFYSTYELKVAAGREYTIILSSSTPVSYKITADDAAKQNVTEETAKEETAVTEETETQETVNNEVAAENTEAVAAEETETTEATEAAEVTETAEATEETETAEATEETETAEGTTEETEAAEGTTDETETSEITTEETEATEVSEETENTEEAEADSEDNTEETSGEEGIEGSDTEENTEVEITEEEVPAVKGWITVDKETFEIGDTVTLTANADIDLENMVAWQTKVQNTEEWTGAGYGETLTVELNEENINNVYRFRMENGSFSDELRLTVTEPQTEENTEEAAEEQTEVEAEPVEDKMDEEAVEDEPTNEAAAETAEEEPAEEVLEETVDEAGFDHEDVLDVSVEYSDENPVFGTIATLKATLTGFEEETDYVIQWQYSTDNEIWVDIEGENEQEYPVEITLENYRNYWRAVVRYKDATATEGQNNP